jgi:predicted carbohydrate-binding protein with CBM5 and CBM33 domain
VSSSSWPQLDMTFNLTLGLENLENKDGKPETYVMDGAICSANQMLHQIEPDSFFFFGQS